MEPTMNPTRRLWLLQSLAAAALAERAVARPDPPSFDNFDAAEAADIEALTAQIIPSTDGPGAREAGVIFFIDRSLSTLGREKRDVYTKGMAFAQRKREDLFPGSHNIAGLRSDQQIELVRAMEHTEFFEVLRADTIVGFLCDPKYGGNRGGVGWKHIGFDNQMAFEPPFGYYDSPQSGVTK
jgi:gluconate 2-dehydrogenase gamma chain